MQFVFINRIICTSIFNGSIPTSAEYKYDHYFVII